MTKKTIYTKSKKKHMKMLTNSVVAILFFVAASSFTNYAPYDFIGTYGVCDSDPSQIKLTLNTDHTFFYQDFSNPRKKIDVMGHWALKGNVVTLENHNSAYAFHDKWRFFKGGQVAKSRKGMTFYTLQKLEASR